MVDLAHTAKFCNVTFVTSGHHDRSVKEGVKILPAKSIDTGASWKKRSTVDCHVTARELTERIKSGNLFLHVVTLRNKFSESDKNKLRVAVAFRFQPTPPGNVNTELSLSFQQVMALDWPEADTFENDIGFVNYRFRDLSRNYSQIHHHFV